MKILKIVATVVAVAASVALIATGFGAPLGTGLLGLTWGTIAAAAALVSAALTYLTMKPPDPIGQTTEWRADPQAGIPYAIGRIGFGGNIVHHTSFGSENKWLFFVTVLSYGPINALESFYTDGILETFSGAGAATGRWASIMWKRGQLGATPEASALSPFGTGLGAGIQWTSASKLSGLAADLWELKHNTKGEQNYNAGVPKPLRVIQGVPVYDPRLDSTFPGGSGACRAGTESTYVYSTNPWLHALTWLLGRYQGGKRVMGVGMAASTIVVSAYAEAATIAETNSWTCGGVIYSTDDKWDRLKAMAQAGGGAPIRLGAQVSCLINAPRVSLAIISKGDLAGEARVVGTPPRRQRVNGIVPRYRSEAHEWEVVSAAEVRVAGYVTEDGGERTREMDFALVTNVNQAAQLARYEIENSRARGPITLQLKPEWIGYKPGDCVTVDIEEIGLVDQPCIIRNRSFDPATGIVTFELMTEDPDKHVAAGVTGTAPPTTDTSGPDLSDIDPPDAADWDVTATSIDDGGISVPALLIEGSVENDTAGGVMFEYRVAGESVWVSAGIEHPLTTRKEIRGVNPGVEYEVAISFVVRGVQGQRLVLTPAATGNSPFPQITGPTSIAISADSGGTTTTPLPKTVRFRATVGGVDMSADTAWTMTPSAGISATINNTPAHADRGVVTITAVNTSGTLALSATIPGFDPLGAIVAVNWTMAPPSSGGGSGATSAVSTVFTDITSTSHVQISETIQVRSTSGGTLRYFAAFYHYSESEGTFAKAQYSLDGSSWSDFAAEHEGTAAYWAEDELWGGDDFLVPGLNRIDEATKTGLTASTDYYCRLVARADYPTVVTSGGYFQVRQ